MILSAEVGFLALAMLFSGTLSDRFGRKPIIFIRCLAGGILTLLCATASSYCRCWWYTAAFARHCSKVVLRRPLRSISVVSPALARDYYWIFYFWQFAEGVCLVVCFATLMMEHVSLLRYDFLYLRWRSDCYGTRGEVVSPDIPTVCSYAFTTAWVLKARLEHLRKYPAYHYVLSLDFILFGSLRPSLNFLAFTCIDRLMS